MIKLYENIRYYRKLNHWTQDQLAKRMGYTDRSMIAKIETGKIDLSQSKIIEFADVFGIAPGDLMGWEDINPDPYEEFEASWYDLVGEKQPITREEIEMIIKYRNADIDTRNMIDRLLEYSTRINEMKTSET